MNNSSKENKVIVLKKEANSIGIKALGRQEVIEVVNKFLIENPTYKAYQDICKGNNLFSSLILSECEF